MKRLTEFILPILLLCLLCPLMLIAAGAEGEVVVSEQDSAAVLGENGNEAAPKLEYKDSTDTEGDSKSTSASEASAPATEPGAPATEPSTPATEPGDTENGSDTEAPATSDARGFFEQLYADITDHMAEITSAIAAIASIILAFCMRRGLTPMLKDALSGMAGAVGKLRESVDAGEKNSEKVSNALGERLAAAESTVEKLTATVNAIAERSSAEKEEQLMREDILTVMSAEVEMLYDIFMSSSLPQYKKDAVGERVAAMRKQLGYREVAEDEA